MMRSSRERLIVVPETRPAFLNHIKLRLDEERRRWVILAPERVFEPDETAVAVLKLCDGVLSVSDIAEALARDFKAPASQILADVTQLLQELADKGLIRAARGRLGAIAI